MPTLPYSAARLFARTILTFVMAGACMLVAGRLLPQVAAGEADAGLDITLDGTPLPKPEFAKPRPPMFQPKPDINFAPFYERETTSRFQRTQIFGPFYEHTRLADGRDLRAVRPFWSVYSDPNRGYWARDWFWPFLVSRRARGESVSRGFMGETVDRDVETTPNGEHDFWYPVYFKGVSDEGDPFFAIFPFFGTIHDFFGYETIRFKMFPYYMQTERVGITATHYFFPIYARVDGPNIKKWRVFPFYGWWIKKDIWKSTFYAWPFVMKGHSLDPERPGKAAFYFPLYGHMSYRDNRRKDPLLLENRTFLWPFFNGYRTHKDMRLYMPWPFISWSRSFDGKSASFAVWPIWGRRRTETQQSRYFLWPFFWGFRELRARGVVARRLHIIPFYWHNLQYYPDGSRYNTFYRLWPFFSTELDQAGTRNIRVLDIWPMRHAEPIDRNLAPFWTLYSYRKSAEREQQVLLWGLWQYRREHGELRKHSLFPFYAYKHADDGSASRLDWLTGLVGRETTVDGKRRTRLFWGALTF